ncbi:monocarboxylate transporter 14-like [Lytechinus variegatus]|uniref:monocarboxylate transporter 14-like n=1 Tax=Lytechinus variegatus TaxID=7654 RepID=UPI001BB10F54|nr:monocarboxylate transporter 14-like [Lytechinus variegatus]
MEWTRAINSTCFPVTLTLFFVSCSHIGAVKVISVLAIDISKSLHATPTDIGAEIGMIIAFYFLTTPIVGALINRWGQPRLFLLIGATLESSALVFTAFANTNIAVFIFLALVGIGNSFLWMTCFLVLNKIAGENFKLLFSLSSCGFPVGMTLFPFLAEELLAVYSWRDVLLIIGALTFNLIPCAMMINVSLDLTEHKACGESRSITWHDASLTGVYGRVHTADCRNCQDSDVSTAGSTDSDSGDRNSHIEPQMFSTVLYDLTYSDQDDSAIDRSSEEESQLDIYGLPHGIVEWWKKTAFYANPLLVFVILSFGTQEFIYSGWHAFLLPKALQQGISARNTIIIALSAAVGNLSGRISVGVLTHRNFDPVNMYLTLSVLNISAIASYGFISYYMVMLVTSCFSGMAIAGRAVLGPLVMKSTVPGEHFSTMIGILYVVAGFFSLLGGYSAGLIATRVTYDATFKLLAVVDILTFAFMGIPKVVELYNSVQTQP